MTRIFVSELFHEGHSFSSLRVDLDAFSVVEGAALLDKARGSGSVLGGAVKELDALRAEVVGGFSAVAPPGGPVRDAVFVQFVKEIADRAERLKPDGVFLGFHGAMLTESDTDPEGALLNSLRQLLGPDVPIAIALDLHAHLTPRMLENADICIACKENPHIDYDIAGATAARLLMAMLRGEVAPVTTAVWVPLVIGAKMETATGPLKDLHGLRSALADKHGFLDVSIYNTTAYLDAPGAGQCVTVIADGKDDAAPAAVLEVARDFWARRDEFASDRPSVAEALRAHKASTAEGRPLIIGDQGDRVLAGAPGDDPGVISEASRLAPAHRILAMITDPEAVRSATRMGVGQTIELGLGAGYSRTAKPLVRVWQVDALGDGRFVQKGPLLAGEQAEMGPVAVLRSDRITVVVTTRPAFSQDVNAFLHLGLRFEDFDVIIVKSGFHFRMSFSDVGPCVVADTQGITNYRPGQFPYRRRRPVYPEDVDHVPDFVVQEFPSISLKAASNASC
ncbi:MAG: M81 family metallopeptidase [Phyllobacteriaceae bacterium]|nr:M81 family metallopeptidase [Phyllobacteriaceae bacterium]